MTHTSQWRMPPGHKFTTEEKENALRDLVFEATTEANSTRLRPDKSAFAGPAFAARDFETYHQDALLDALKRTDALYVLNDLLNPGRR